MGGERDNRWWDGWMESLTQWTWVWVNSSDWWWKGGPGVLQSMGSQRVGQAWATELNWCILWRNVCLGPLPFMTGICVCLCVCVLNCMSYFYVLEMNPLWISPLQVFSPLLFHLVWDFLCCAVGSHIRHYWQNGGTAPLPLLVPQARTRDEGIRPCDSDLFFPLLGWVDWKEY